MMWIKRNLPILIGAVIFAFFVALSIYLLKQAKEKQNEVQIKHRELVDRLQALTSKNPYPSPPNIEALASQAVTLSNYFERIYASLPKYQKEYTTMRPWEFKGYLERRVDNVRKHCEKNQVELPASFTCGFIRYVGGTSTPPKESDTDELAHQLDILEALVNLLVDCKVGRISALKRSYLPEETGFNEDKVDGGGSWLRDPKLLYESQTVEVSFQCTDETLKSVLNTIANSRSIVLLVRQISVDSERVGPREPDPSSFGPSPARAAAAPPNIGPGSRGEPPFRMPAAQAPTQTQPQAAEEVKMVMGNEIATVHLRLDVIEVKPPQTAATEQKPAAAEEGEPKKG